MAKSYKPIVWSLFAGGGMAAAFLAPAMIFVTGLAVPAGLLDEEALAYDRMILLARNPMGKLLLFAVLFLVLWHAAHRLRMTWHDLGIGANSVMAGAWYLMAALGSIVAGLTLLSI